MQEFAEADGIFEAYKVSDEASLGGPEQGGELIVMALFVAKGSVDVMVDVVFARFFPGRSFVRKALFLKVGIPEDHCRGEENCEHGLDGQSPFRSQDLLPESVDFSIDNDENGPEQCTTQRQRDAVGNQIQCLVFIGN